MTESTTAKAIARSFYDSYNAHDLQSSWDTYISPQLVNHVMGGIYDREAWLAADSQLFPAFGDFSLEILDQVAEGDKVATRYRLGGTQTGEFFGIPASGRNAFLSGTAVDRIENGQIVEHWGDLDFTAFLQTLASA